jgi:HEAT repeat protein
VALTREEKETILAALEKAPPDLEPVRQLLTADEQWSVRRRL